MLEFWKRAVELSCRHAQSSSAMVMHSYASWTGTKKNLKALRSHGWRLLMSPDTWSRAGWGLPVWDNGDPAPYAIDNGAWGAYNQGVEWDPVRFKDLVDSLHAGADWTVAPDIVAGGMKSLARSEKWLPILPGRVLLAVQDGMTDRDVAPLVGERVGIFVGGSTEWKIRTMRMWGIVAAERNCWLHIGRVNSMRRIAMCAAAGAHSYDGTSVTRYSMNVGKLDSARLEFAQLNVRAPWTLPNYNDQSGGS